MAHFPDECFAYFESDDDEELAGAILELHNDPERAERMVEQAAAVNEPFRWSHQRERYLSAVNSLVSQHLAERDQEPAAQAAQSAPAARSPTS